ncbi:PKD domain-containing protein, partial [candidate division WOR-3 bacterium]|nr:PKD domain-containing protein [candidate division WOR-3 bacterium]
MSRWLRLAAAAAAVVLLIGTGCKKKNSAPDIPSILGPNSARPGDTLTFRFSTTDPDGDSVSYMVSWAQGESTPWSAVVASGVEYAPTHVYADSGTYYVKAKARDSKELETEWTDSVRVRVGSFPPNAPLKPTGPTSCSTGIAYTFKTRASHPLNDSVSIQFYWGFGPGDTSGWGPMVKSDEFYEQIHTWSLKGTYKVAARARDVAGFESPWSESLAVAVDTAQGPPRGEPRDLVLVADSPSDSTVRLTWSNDSTPTRYVILFRQVGAANYDSIGCDTLLSRTFVHNPNHHTGWYKVAAVYDTARMTSSETRTTVPVANTAPSIPELSAAGDTGYWWKRSTGKAFLYTMDTTANVDSVDFYITDFKTGFAG